MLRILLAVVHLLALGIGLGAVFARARALGRLTSAQESMRRIFTADAWWGVAALLWLTTGLWRALAGTEKASGYYWSNHVFYAKMGLFLAIFLLELYPMVTLVRWRSAVRTKTLSPPVVLAPTARRIARISDLQTLLVIATVCAAVLMARGHGAQ